jgi:sugar lactone lactonase YvrE
MPFFFRNRSGPSSIAVADQVYQTEGSRHNERFLIHAYRQAHVPGISGVFYRSLPVTSEPMLLGESPLWHAEEGALYWIDIPGKAVHKLVLGTQQHQRWDMPEEPGSIVKHAQGGLVVALRTGMFHLNTGNGALSLLLEAPYDTARIRFNDGRCDAAGRFWCGTIYEPRVIAMAARSTASSAMRCAMRIMRW